MNKRQQIAEIESGITCPVYFKNNGGLRFHCKMNGEHFYINLTREEVPAFLRSHDFIEEVIEGKMYVRRDASFIDKSGEIRMFSKLIEVPYESLEFTKCQIVTFCALSEWDRVQSMMFTGRVVKMFNHFLKPAA